MKPLQKIGKVFLWSVIGIILLLFALVNLIGLFFILGVWFRDMFM